MNRWAWLCVLFITLGPSVVRGEGLLTAEGRDIVDETGQVVPLKGVCLGSWLFIETWISSIDYPVHGRLYEAGYRFGVGPASEDVLKDMGSSEEWDNSLGGYIDTFESKLALIEGAEIAGRVADEARVYPSLFDDSELPLREVLTARFGSEVRDDLLDTFHQSWITEMDVEMMAEMGMSLIRLPATYREILEVGSDDLPLEPVRLNERVMAHADDLIGWAKARGMYVTFDIQEAPGGQNDYAGESTLYTDPHMQQLTLDMWRLLSQRYKSESAVAMYSLLAEPFSAPTVEEMIDLYDRLHDLIRAQGDNHLLVIHDGFKGVNQLPDPVSLGWTQVVYSTHLFEWGMPGYATWRALIGAQARAFEYMQDRYNLPFYVGSFSTFLDERYAYRTLEFYLQTFETYGWPWTMWTWKKVDDPIDRALFGTSTAWGVLQTPSEAWQRADPWRDDAELLARHLATGTSTNMAPNNQVYSILVNYLD